MLRNIAAYFILLLLSYTVQVNSQICQDVAQYGRCSANSACGCFHMVNVIDTGICGFLWTNCAQLTACSSLDNACHQPDTVCVQHPRCQSLPLCYPVSMIDQRICPSLTINNTATIISTTTTTTTTTAMMTTTVPQPICMNSNLLTFENRSSYSQVPDGYYGLNWMNAFTVTTPNSLHSAHTTSIFNGTSNTWALSNMNGSSMTIRSASSNLFNIESFTVATVWDDDVTLSMVSQRDSAYYKEASFKIGRFASTKVELNWFNINAITLYAYRTESKEASVFVMNNLCVDINTNTTLSTTTTTTTTSVPTSVNQCSSNELFYENRCHYLDGTNGTCNHGYSLGSETLLSRVAELFIGLSYKRRISSVCCILTSEKVANYGFGLHQCNKPGPFLMAPALHEGGCRNYTKTPDNQLTFCVSN
ncbi:unnamed protein product [Adineta ricciae]|uniref:Uncharacterized protein n=1 Tax=Adineta ricciae TaxID=249248 RepID=A0A814GQ11_ADIRI|nr:unnamed protein product [Adineta ricciae]